VIRHLRDIAIIINWDLANMKNSFNYSGFCKCAYSFNYKKILRGGVNDDNKSNIRNNPAWRVPPYLAQTPANRYLKWNE